MSLSNKNVRQKPSLAGKKKKNTIKVVLEIPRPRSSPYSTPPPPPYITRGGLHIGYSP